MHRQTTQAVCQETEFHRPQSRQRTPLEGDPEFTVQREKLAWTAKAPWRDMHCFSHLARQHGHAIKQAMNGIAEMKAPYTWCISFLLALTVPFQSGCNKNPEGRVEKKLSAEFSDTERGPDPFSQEALPATTQSQDDSSKLLRETLIPLVDWPEQPLSERLSLIEKEAAKVGISVKTSKALRKRMKTGALIYPELRIRNVPLAIAIRYTCDATILYYELTDSGDLLFLLSNEKASGELDP